MKLCEEYAAPLDLYVDGELSLEELEQVQAHLDACPACRAYVDDALAISAAFPDPEETEVPDGFAESVMARINAEALPAPKKQKKTPWVGVLASLVACCAIVFLQQNGPLSGAANEAATYDTAVTQTAETAPADAEDCFAADDAEPGDGSGGTPALQAEPRAVEDIAANETESAKTADGEVLVLTAAEAGDLLASYSPVEETEEALRYRLTEEDYRSLLDALPEELRLAAPVWDADGVEVLVEK